LGLAARRRRRDAVERAGHAARDAERHLPRPVAPHARARRNAVRLRAAQLLADQLRGAAGRRFRAPLSPLGARARERSGRSGAARRANFVEMTGDALPLAPDGHAAVDVSAWGTATLRLFTPQQRVG